MKISEIIAYVIHWILYSLGFLSFLAIFIVAVDMIPVEVIEAIPKQIDTYWLLSTIMSMFLGYLTLLFFSCIGGFIRFLITRKFVLYPWRLSKKEVRTYSEDIRLISNLFKSIIPLFKRTIALLEFNEIKNHMLVIIVFLFIFLIVIFLGYKFLPVNDFFAFIILAILFSLGFIFKDIKEKLNGTEVGENNMFVGTGEVHPVAGIFLQLTLFFLFFWFINFIFKLIF
tara:strand:+ start:3814 stop:4494 length:681 start_codon:yes stop_codon:yes gene_type:complete